MPDERERQIGSGLLTVENLPEERQRLFHKIMNDIEHIRQDASTYFLSEDYFERQNKVVKNNRQYNFISLLGGRGYGKSSLMLTILDRLDKSQKKLEKIECSGLDAVEPRLNIILPVIDPDLFNAEKDALGWVIFSLAKTIAKYEAADMSGSHCKNEKIKKVSESYKNLKRTYIKSRQNYKSSIGGFVGGTAEFTEINENIVFADMELLDRFESFVDDFVDYLREKYRNREGRSKQPLIFITFDDIDLSPEHAYDILNVIMNYLWHPAIVVFILGDYDTFKESVTLDFLRRENIPPQFGKDDEIVEGRRILAHRKARADESLAKALPNMYVNELTGFSAEDKLAFTPYGRIGARLLDLMNEFNFMQYIYNGTVTAENLREKYEEIKGIGESKQGERAYSGFFEDYARFLIYLEQAEDVSNRKKFIYAPVLSGNPRGLINLYYQLENYIRDGRLIKKFEDYKAFLRPDYTKEDIHKYTEAVRNNFQLLKVLHDFLVSNNTDLHSASDLFDLRNIIKIDDFDQVVQFDFSHITINAIAGFRYNEFNVSVDLLRMELSYKMPDSGGGRVQRLTQAQSAFVQMFYDLAKMVLPEDRILITQDKDLTGICLYKSGDLKIHAINFKYFYDYYLFQEIYQLMLPIIVSSRSHGSEMRERLKAFIMTALGWIKKVNEDLKMKVELTWKDWEVYEENPLAEVESVEEYFIEEVGNRLAEKEGTAQPYNLLEFVRCYQNTPTQRVGVLPGSGALNDKTFESVYDEMYDKILRLNAVYPTNDQKAYWMLKYLKDKPVNKLLKKLRPDIKMYRQIQGDGLKKMILDMDIEDTMKRIEQVAVFSSLIRMWEKFKGTGDSDLYEKFEIRCKVLGRNRYTELEEISPLLNGTKGLSLIEKIEKIDVIMTRMKDYVKQEEEIESETEVQ